MRITWHKTLLRKIKSIFFPEIMVGVREHRQPVNRRERRAAEAIARKQKSRKQHRR